MKVNVAFTLDDTEDKDIIRWLERQRKGGRSEAIRCAIRAGWSADLARLERKLDEILSRLENGVVAVRESQTVVKSERRSALDNLGL